TSHPAGADHPVYFGSATYLTLTLSTVDEGDTKRKICTVNAQDWCKFGKLSIPLTVRYVMVEQWFTSAGFRLNAVMHIDSHRKRYKTFVISGGTWRFTANSSLRKVRVAAQNVGLTSVRL